MRKRANAEASKALLPVCRFAAPLALWGLLSGILLACSQSQSDVPKTSTRDSAVRSTSDTGADVDADMARVSLDLARVGAATSSGKAVHCILADTYTALESQPDPSGLPSPPREIGADLLQAEKREEQALCAVFSQADLERAAIFTIVKNTGAVPPGLYIFSVFDLSEDDTKEEADEDDERFVEIEVGPLRALEDCQRIEAVARSAHVPTRSCRPWTPQS